LIKLSSTFKKLSSDKILLSGILKGQTEVLINSYDWIKLKKIDEMDNWTLLLGEL
jgi:ribosomal protein L11 methylase PrmA